MGVFVSYSSRDTELVKEICENLKQNNIPYWVAYENNSYGESFSKSIIENLNKSEVVVLLVSEASCQSSHVLSEVTYARNHKKQIIPIAVGDVALTEEFEYYLAPYHFLSYSSSPAFFDTLNSRIGELLDSGVVSDEKVVQRISAESYKPKSNSSKGLKVTFFLIAIVLLVVIGIVIANLLSDDKNQPSDGTVTQGHSISGNTDSESNQSADLDQGIDSNRSELNTEINSSQNTDSTVQDSNSTTQDTVSSQSPQGENQISEQYREDVEAFEYQDDMMKSMMTKVIKVGDRWSPNTVWPNAVILSQNTAIAVADGKTVLGVSKGTTYIVLAAKPGSTVKEIYKIVVE